MSLISLIHNTAGCGQCLLPGASVVCPTAWVHLHHGRNEERHLLHFDSFVQLRQHRFRHAVLQGPVAALVGIRMASCLQVMAMLAIAAVQAPHQ